MYFFYNENGYKKQMNTYVLFISFVFRIGKNNNHSHGTYWPSFKSPSNIWIHLITL